MSLNDYVIEVISVTPDWEERGLQSQGLVPGPLLLWNRPQFCEALVVLLTLLLFLYQLVLG